MPTATSIAISISRPTPRKGGFKIEFDNACLEPFRLAQDVEGWAIVNDFLRLHDARGRIVFEFTEVESGDVRGRAEGRGSLFPAEPAGRRSGRADADQMAGEWNVMRGGKPICAVNLTSTRRDQPRADSRFGSCSPAMPLVTRSNPWPGGSTRANSCSLRRTARPGVSRKATPPMAAAAGRRRSGHAGAALDQRPLDQLQPLQARMPVLADDDVVVHGDAERLRHVDDRFASSGCRRATASGRRRDDCAPG